MSRDDSDRTLDLVEVGPSNLRLLWAIWIAIVAWYRGELVSCAVCWVEGARAAAEESVTCIEYVYEPISYVSNGLCMTSKFVSCLLTPYLVADHSVLLLCK